MWHYIGLCIPGSEIPTWKNKHFLCPLRFIATNIGINIQLNNRNHRKQIKSMHTQVYSYSTEWFDTHDIAIERSFVKLNPQYFTLKEECKFDFIFSKEALSS